jgi:hypothetical protein
MSWRSSRLDVPACAEPDYGKGASSSSRRTIRSCPPYKRKRGGVGSSHIGPSIGPSSGGRAVTSRFSGPAAAVAVERFAQLGILLDAGTLATPKILSQKAQDVLDFSAIPGPTLFEVDYLIDNESFAAAWKKWSREWVAQVGGPGNPASRDVLNSLPLHSAEQEATKVWQPVTLWLEHNPALLSQREALRTAAEEVTANLLRTAPDPLVWAHGGLHDKQIIATDGQSPLGLLDFDHTARAEAALDLASMDVYLELRLRENRMTPERYRTAHTQVLAAAEELHVSPDRFRAYSHARWLRLAYMPLRGRFSLALAVLAEKKAA